jgi:hypothetical protein
MAAHVVGACLAGQTRSHDRDGGGKLQLVVGQDVLRGLAWRVVENHGLDPPMGNSEPRLLRAIGVFHSDMRLMSFSG